MLARLVRSAANVRDTDPPHVVSERIGACVSRHVAPHDRPRVAQFLADMVGAPGPANDSVQQRAAQHDPVLRADQVRLAFQDWLAAETSAAPLLVLLEDLQWGDATTVEWMGGVLRALRDQPLCVVALARPALEERFPRLWADRNVTTFTLGPLRMRPAARLVSAALDSVEPARAELIAHRSGGNPFFLEELVRAEAEGRTDDVPDTVLATLQARLEDLPSSSRLVLRAASVYGDCFARDGVRALAGEEAHALDSILGALMEREIILRATDEEAARGDEFTFAQGLWREASYATLVEADRRLGHGLAAAWLEEHRPGGALAIAEHYELATMQDRAGPWFAVAARHALEGGDYGAALDRAQRAEQCGVDGEQRGELSLVQAEAHKWRGENARAEQCASEAMELLQPGTLGWYSAAGEAAAALGKLGQQERLVELARRLCGDQTQERPSGTRGIAMARTATQLVLAGCTEAADALLALLGSDEVDPSIAGWVFEARAVRAGADRQPAARVELARTAARCFNEVGDVRNACLQLTSAGFALNEIGAYERAQESLSEAVALADRLGLSNAVATAQAQLGRALARCGQHEAAEQVLRVAVDTLREQGNARLEGVARTYLAALLLDLTQPEEAEAQAQQAVERLVKVAPLKASADAQLAQVLLALGRLHEASELAQEAMQALETFGSLTTGEGLVRLLRAETLFATGQVGDARVVIRGAQAELERRAEQIDAPELRAAFDEVREHVRIRQLFSQHGESGEPWEGAG